MKEQQQASKQIWPYPGAGPFVVLMGNVERKGWCWSGTDCKGRSGSAEQRGGSFIIVRGCGGGGKGGYWTLLAHWLTDSWWCLIQTMCHGETMRFLLKTADMFTRRKKEGLLARCGCHISMWCTEPFVKADLMELEASSEAPKWY